MKPPFKPSPVELDQRLLFPSNIFDLLSKDHECYLYEDIFQQLDTSELESNYSELGQRAYHPKLIVSILIYAYSRGVFSSREIERRCHEDLSFMYIAKMNCPNFRVLSDFRKDHAEFFHDCFKQTVKLAMELKLASLGHISLDGSKFKANSSKHKAMSYKRLKEKEQELKPALEQVKETTGELPDKLSADNGYMSGDNLEALDESPVDVYIATDKGEKKNKIPLSEAERKLVKADFDYNEEENTFTCPGGQILEMKRESEGNAYLSGRGASLCKLPVPKPLLPIQEWQRPKHQL